MAQPAATINAPEPQSERPWERPPEAPEYLARSDYGFVSKGRAVGCSPEELVSTVAARGVPEIELAWTPETPQPVSPEELPLLLAAFKKRAVKEARKALYWGAGFLAFGVGLALLLGARDMIFRNFFFVIGAVAAAGGVLELYRARRYTQEDARRDAERARFAQWLKAQHVTIYTICLCAIIIVVLVAQFLAGEKESVIAAGLVKPAVWQGQYWRLLTCTLLHVNFTHFWMNILGLYELGRVVEQFTHRAYVPVVFLFSAVCGSVFSLILYPNTTSVGSSGGLMGLLGLMTAAAYLRPQKFPQGYFKLLLEAIGFVALLGLVGFAFIDNAAHLGGLVGGVFLGWLFLRRGPAGDPRSAARAHALGVACLIITGLIAALAVSRMLR